MNAPSLAEFFSALDRTQAGGILSFCTPNLLVKIHGYAPVKSQGSESNLLSNNCATRRYGNVLNNEKVSRLLCIRN